MFSLCRLCATSTNVTDLTTTISELEAKLSYCCGWERSENEIQLPQKACSSCVTKLENSWEFAESIRAAENQLSKLTSETIEAWAFEVTPLSQEEEQCEIKLDIDHESAIKSDTDIDDDIFNEPAADSDDGSGKQLPNKRKLTRYPFLSALSQSDCHVDGMITESGIEKLKKLFPDMISVSWDDCQYKCDKCDRKFKGPQSYHSHLVSIHMNDGGSISCFYCKFTTDREYSLHRHIASEHFLHLKYRCLHCTNYYWDTQEMTRHRNLHTDVEYKCELCGQSYANRDTLYTHVSSHSKRPTNEEKFTCDICQKLFSTKNSIKNHMALHTKKFDHMCDQCGWKFQSKGNLKNHLVTTHGTERPFLCTQCNKRFKTKHQLKNHSKHHEDIRPHECTFCGKKFRRPYTLNVHIRSHTNTCPYTCRFCGKSFRHNITLQTHERSHTSEKPYACTNCEYRSTSKGNLNKHMLRVHSIDFRNHIPQQS